MCKIKIDLLIYIQDLSNKINMYTHNSKTLFKFNIDYIIGLFKL